MRRGLRSALTSPPVHAGGFLVFAARRGGQRNDPSLGASWGRPTELPTEGGLVPIRASSALGHGQVQATSNLAASRSFRIAHSVERLGKDCGQPRSIMRIPLKPRLGIHAFCSCFFILDYQCARLRMRLMRRTTLLLPKASAGAFRSRGGLSFPNARVVQGRKVGGW